MVNGSVPGCQLTNVSSSTYNGKWQYVNVPIPANYTCTVDQAGGCWFTVRFNFPGGVPKRHHHVDRQDRRRPGPAHQVTAVAGDPAAVHSRARTGFSTAPR